MGRADKIRRELDVYADETRVPQLKRFFKTGLGEYGEGDEFVGIRVPDIRKVCRAHRNVNLADIVELFDSGEHEYRLAAVLLLVEWYKSADSVLARGQAYELYLTGLKNGWINSWDIIDVSAEYVLGAYWHELGQDDHRKELAGSTNIWERRAAIISTFYDTKQGDAEPTLALAELLVDDSEDLIQKAVGWMLREVGKRVSETDLRRFLDAHAATMPRTMLRYSIERLDTKSKKRYMQMAASKKKKRG